MLSVLLSFVVGVVVGWVFPAPVVVKEWVGKVMGK